MQYVQRLLSIGFSLDEAVTVCHSMAKEGSLEEFVSQQEREYAAAIILEAEADGQFDF